MTERTREAVLDELNAVAKQLRDVEHRRTELYERRTALFVEARTFAPPTTHKVLAEFALVGDLAVGAALRKHERDHPPP